MPYYKKLFLRSAWVHLVNTTSATQTFTPTITELSVKQRLSLINNVLASYTTIFTQAPLTNDFKSEGRWQVFKLCTLHKNEESQVPLMRGGSELADLGSLWQQRESLPDSKPQTKATKTKDSWLHLLPWLPQLLSHNVYTLCNDSCEGEPGNMGGWARTHYFIHFAQLTLVRSSLT